MRSLLVLAALTSCTATKPAPPDTQSAQASAASASAPASAASASAQSAAPAAGKPCGALDCRLFDTPEEAFAVVIADKPRVLGVGEGHAQKGTSGIDSSTKRFTERFLPMLKDKASDLIVELMLPPAKGCKPAEQEVRTKQKEVTK